MLENLDENNTLLIMKDGGINLYEFANKYKKQNQHNKTNNAWNYFGWNVIIY
jgi:hypothetical protein